MSIHRHVTVWMNILTSRDTMKKTGFIILCVILIVSLLGCSTLVQIDSDPEGAKVYLNEQPKGETPYTEKLSNFIFNDYQAKIVMEGYETINVELEKEAKVGPIIGGLFILPLFLWCYGPEEYQYFELTKE